LRRRLDPVRVVAVVDLVHVLAEDPVLRARAREADRQAGLLQLALQRPLLRDVEVPHELLRNRRAALDHVARAEVLPGCAGDALVVDAAVLVEAVVLDRDRRLAHPRADAPEGDRRPVALGRDRAQQRAIGRVDERVLADLDRLQIVQVAVGAEPGDGADAGGDHGQHDHEQDDEDQRRAALALRLDPAPACAAAAAGVLEPGVAPAAATPRRRWRGHAKTPASRRRSCARRRSSLSSRSALGSSGAQTLTCRLAFSARSTTDTSARSSWAASRSSVRAASRSVSRGTWTVTCASFFLERIEELRMLSEAIFSFGTTSRSLSSIRMKV